MLSAVRERRIADRGCGFGRGDGIPGEAVQIPSAMTKPDAGLFATSLSFGFRKIFGHSVAGCLLPVCNCIYLCSRLFG